MKIAVFSDSHGLTAAMAAILKSASFDMVFHLGDYVRDAEALARRFPQIAFEYVAGNGDAFSPGAASQKTLMLEGKKIVLTHGHLLSVQQGMSRLTDEGARTRCDLLLFGHTHIPYSGTAGGRLYLNPGSISAPRGNTGCTYAELTLAEGEIQSVIKTMN